MKAYAPRSRNQKLYHEASAKLNGGPGGLHCTCCGPGNMHGRPAKQFLHRVLRRVLKLRLRKMEVEIN